MKKLNNINTSVYEVNLIKYPCFYLDIIRHANGVEVWLYSTMDFIKVFLWGCGNYTLTDAEIIEETNKNIDYYVKDYNKKVAGVI